MADLNARLALPSFADTRIASASVSPAPNAPTWRKLRRVTPSQKRWAGPGNRSMVVPSRKWPVRQGVGGAGGANPPSSEFRPIFARSQQKIRRGGLPPPRLLRRRGRDDAQEQGIVGQCSEH